MRRIPLALLLLAASLPMPLESQPVSGVLAETREPAPIKAARAPRPGEYPPGFDALHYDIRVTLPAIGSVIEGTTEIELASTPAAPGTLALDFTGLQVTGVRIDGAASRFVRDAGKLLISLPPGRSSEGSMRVAVDYRGKPDDGLIIRDNVHGHRTAFADNWPNRARFWFPAIDHPADKATASFAILAPPGWEVVANGVRAAAPATVQLPDGSTRRRFDWRMTQPISPYNMVIGAADFRVENVGRPCLSDARCIDVTTWLFPESADKAAASFLRAGAMVDYYSQLIAPFPYDKLAHVQGSTVLGGMENATAIFYNDRLVDERNIEEVVAHETAHQWFGDAVTEAAWPDIWLSEGFAMYFGALFFEHADGEAVFRRIMEVYRLELLSSKGSDEPIIDPTEQDLFKLLNTNNYQKGAWVLHMLRGMLGDEPFFDAIRRYYRDHEHGTASTVDLKQALETASGKDLGEFFEQWLFSPGYPRLRVSSQWNPEQRTATVLVEQVQSERWPTLRLPLTIEVTTAAGPTRRQVEVDERRERYSFELDSSPTEVVLDPDGWLLKEIVR